MKGNDRARPLTQVRVTHDDLAWWLARAANLEWIFARTYANTAPHSYVVDGRSRGMSREDYVRAARVIHTFGRPAKFYGMTSIYLASPDGRLKWWTMHGDVTQTSLINQATTDRLYGVQNAPVTESGIQTRYDSAATNWDQMHPTSERLAAGLHEAFAALAGEYAPALLDAGCGTGRVLDLGLTSPDRYAGVDPSTPMLNQLVRKHPGVGAVYPMRIEAALGCALFTPGQFEIVSVVMPAQFEIDANALAALEVIASRGLVTVRGDELVMAETRNTMRRNDA